jgi:hypothetical protein
MQDRELITLLEKRVREVERLAADCILDGDVMRLQQSVNAYRRKARVPKSKRVKVWPTNSKRSASFGWPRG